jgi:hypothetical protein
MLCFCLAGCADGPFGSLASINPYYRSEWQKDEQHGPTFHAQLAELRVIRQNPNGLPPNERASVVPLLSGIVQNSPNAVLRAEAVLTLAEFPTPDAIPALRLAATDEEADVRIAVCRALGRRKDSEALQILSQTISDDSDLDVRIAAATELARFPKQQQAVQALGLALNDKDPALQHRAVQSLKDITGQGYGDSVPAWRDFVEGRTPNPPAPPSIAERLSQFRLF